MAYDKIISESWAETFAIVLLLIGFFLALFLNSAVLAYFVIILAGLIAGRFFFQRRIAQPIFPFILIIVGFLLGFLLGSIWANKTLLIVLFIASTVASYFLHKKGYLEYFKTAGFIK
ncbi:hypothetical protein KY306_02820 [Candidatus Woesearchaeota archaeon]|nr:hypothetical protein [Candidatus Woesearchaeota archaeon]